MIHITYSKRTIKSFVRVLVILAIIAALIITFVELYYRADYTALGALSGNEKVGVIPIEEGYLFNGPGEDEAIIFYPGARVETEAYAPLLSKIAAEGKDVFLVSMPMKLAVLDKNKADDILKKYDYDTWYVAGHSLGGAAASIFASENAQSLSGVILFASMPPKKLDDSLKLISVYGSEDGVLKMNKYDGYKENWPTDSAELVIQGGNHAQFGNYGKQLGDGDASITSAAQQDKAVEFIVENCD